MLWTEIMRFNMTPCFSKCSPSYKTFTFIFPVATYIFQDNRMATKLPEKSQSNPDISKKFGMVILNSNI